MASALKFVRVQLLFMDSTAVLIRRGEKFFFTRKQDEEKFSPISSELERGDTLRESLRKNIREITGVEVEIEEKITRIENSDNRKHWYLAEEVSPSEENPDPEQINGEDGEWISLDEKDMIEDETVRVIEEHRDKLEE